MDVPTDCPQRDERLGWTGDAQVFSPTASFNFETVAFYEKWLKDVALDQQDDGAVPYVIPNILSHATRKGDSASSGWADVAVVVPWTVYQAFGDQASAGGAVPEHEGLGGIHAEASRRQIFVQHGIYVWGLAGVCDDGFGLSGSDDGQGFYPDGVFCEVDGIAGEDGGGAGEERRCSGV